MQSVVCPKINSLTDDMLCSVKMITYGYMMGGRLTTDHAVLLQFPKEHFGCFAVPCFTRNQGGTNYCPPTHMNIHKLCFSLSLIFEILGSLAATRLLSGIIFIILFFGDSFIIVTTAVTQ